MRGKRVLIICEQGLGDQLLFLRFLTLLKAKNAHIRVRASPKFLPLFEQNIYADIWEADTEKLPDDVDEILYMGDLPYALGIEHDKDIPPPLPLSPSPTIMTQVYKQLRDLGPPPYAALTWQAGLAMKKEGRFYKRIDKDILKKYFENYKGTLIILQRDVPKGEITEFLKGINCAAHNLTYLTDSMPHLLALLAIVDENIGVSNSNMHIRACLGKGSRILLHTKKDWRLRLKKDGSALWFPATKIYPNDRIRGWIPALNRLKKDLDL